VELSPDPVVILQDGKYRFVNAVFHRVFGYTREEVDKGLSFFKLVQEKDVEAVRKRYEDRLAAKDLPRTFRLDLVAKDGAMIPTETSASLIQFEGRPADIVILRDISERVKAVEERFQLEIQIQQAQKMESLGILAGGIAHDFNNLLMGVLGNADLALADITPENPARPYLQDIFASSKHLADLTRQMLAYSGRGRFVVEPISLNRLVEEMVHLLKVSISKKATLKLDLSADLGTVMADASQIRQVILNLIVNASEALGDEEGVISLRTGQVEADAAYLSETYIDEGLEPGRFTMLSVSDTGQGMDRETQTRIFDPFFTTKFTGRGLGLAAVLGIVRGHGGAIKVRSEPGTGTTFTLLLPVGKDALPNEAATEAIARAPTGSGTLLVVDDETTVRAILKKMLSNAGYDVIVASDGPEALGILERDADGFSAVLLDLTMPQMSGEETFEAIRRIRSSLPVVLMSGFDESDVLERFKGEDIAGFIHKPFELKTIHYTLRKALANG
jgi:PAS domain S-box-containing protein